MGYDPLGASTDQHTADQYTVQAVVDEVLDRSARMRIQTAIDTGALSVAKPSKESKSKVVAQSTQLGDIGRVSVTDLDVLALAFDFHVSGGKCYLVTDDYSVQNVAHRMGIPFRSLATPGIKYQFQWRLHCPACGRSYPTVFREALCPTCGTALKRRVSRKRKVHRT